MPAAASMLDEAAVAIEMRDLCADVSESSSSSSSSEEDEERDAERDRAAWARAVGWCRPAADIHLLRKPSRARPVAWWKLIGPETRADVLWRAELRVCSVYSLSSLSFAAVGLLALLCGRATYLEGALLSLTGLTSFQADVTFLGIDHAWRTADTALAVGLVAYYVARALVRHSAWSLAALVPLAAALRSFYLSQRSVTFRERAYHHTGWHFGVQFALLLLIFGDAVQRTSEALARGVG